MPPGLTRPEAERLVNTYADLILRLSYTYLSHTHDAQDICQTVFLKLIERRPAFASPEHEKAWIIRTTINACKDHLKSHWRKTTVPIEAARHIPAPAAEPGSILAAAPVTQKRVSHKKRVHLLIAAVIAAALCAACASGALRSASKVFANLFGASQEQASLLEQLGSPLGVSCT